MAETKRRKPPYRAGAGKHSAVSKASTAAAPEPEGRRDLRAALLLTLIAFLVYNANFRTMGTGDTLPARFLPFAVLGEGSLHLDSVEKATISGHGHPYWILESRHERPASMYPVVAPLLVTPLYAPAIAYLNLRGWADWRLAYMGEIMEKVAASVVAAVAVAVMFLALRRRLERRDALLLAAAFAFCTNTWVTSSQALWQHGPAELFVALALLLLTAPEPRWPHLAGAGIACGLLCANRPPDALFCAAFALYVLITFRWRSFPFFAGIGAIGFLALAYNLWMFNVPTGGYGIVLMATPTFFTQPIPVGFAGLLVSPGKGLLVFAPFFLFLVLYLRKGVRERLDRKTVLLTLCLAVAVVAQIALYARTDWRGGYSYGPRYLTDALPILTWMLAPVVATLTRGPRRLFLAACLFGFWVQMVGAFAYQGTSEGTLNADFVALWRPENAQFLFEARNGPAPLRLLELAGVPKEWTVPADWLP